MAPTFPGLPVETLIRLLTMVPSGSLVTARTHGNTGNLAVMVDGKDWGYVEMCRNGAIFQYERPTIH